MLAHIYTGSWAIRAVSVEFWHDIHIHSHPHLHTHTQHTHTRTCTAHTTHIHMHIPHVHMHGTRHCLHIHHTRKRHTHTYTHLTYTCMVRDIAYTFTNIHGKRPINTHIFCQGLQICKRSPFLHDSFAKETYKNITFPQIIIRVSSCLIKGVYVCVILYVCVMITCSWKSFCTSATTLLTRTKATPSTCESLQWYGQFFLSPRFFLALIRMSSAVWNWSARRPCMHILLKTLPHTTKKGHWKTCQRCRWHCWDSFQWKTGL